MQLISWKNLYFAPFFDLSFVSIELPFGLVSAIRRATTRYNYLIVMFLFIRIRQRLRHPRGVPRSAKADGATKRRRHRYFRDSPQKSPLMRAVSLCVLLSGFVLLSCRQNRLQLEDINEGFETSTRVLEANCDTSMSTLIHRISLPDR